MNTFNITIRNRANKLGLFPVNFTATLNRKSVVKSMGIAVTLPEWQNICTNNKKPCTNALQVSEIRQKATSIILRLQLDKKLITPEDLIIQVFGDRQTVSKSDFYSFIDVFLKQKNYPLKHVSSYETLKEQLKSFNKYATFSDLNYAFCVTFATYLQTEYKNSNNTRIKKIQLLRCILSEAVKHGYLKTNAACEVKLKSEKTNRQALSKADLLKLENLFTAGTLPASTQNVLKYFLFCVYTGLRFGDLLNFKTTDIQNGVIKLIQNKTGGSVTIPLIPKAVALLPEYKFNVLSNQKSNEHLKKIKKHLEIKTNISCHVARHTFATIGLNSGISLEVVCEVLGHSSTRVTKIYAKMLDDFKINELKKWGN